MFNLRLSFLQHGITASITIMLFAHLTRVLTREHYGFACLCSDIRLRSEVFVRKVCVQLDRTKADTLSSSGIRLVNVRPHLLSFSGCIGALV